MEETNAVAMPFMSAEINEISSALSAFQGEVEQPSLNKTNPYFKSKYVDLSGVLKSTQKTMSKHGLAVTQLIIGGDIITLITHKSGQWLKSICPIGSYKSQQDRGSAITYTKRYALCAMLGVAADTDDDGNAATDADKARQKVGSIGTMMSGDQIASAIEEINSAADLNTFNAIYAKWQRVTPSMCAPTTEFYKACTAKHNKLKAPKA